MKLCSDAESAFRKIEKVYRDCDACKEALSTARDAISKDLKEARGVELAHSGGEWAWWRKEGIIW